MSGKAKLRCQRKSCSTPLISPGCCKIVVSNVGTQTEKDNKDKETGGRREEKTSADEILQ